MKGRKKLHTIKDSMGNVIGQSRRASTAKKMARARGGEVETTPSVPRKRNFKGQPAAIRPRV